MGLSATFDCRRFSTVRDRLGKAFARVETVARELDAEGAFTLDDFKTRYYNKQQAEAVTLYTLWEEAAKAKSAGTEESYMQALRRFRADMGKAVRMTEITPELVARWRERMVGSGLSKTTANIYLRAARVVVNEAVRRNLLAVNTATLFADLTIGGRNSYQSRRHEYMDVPTWRRLWQLPCGRLFLATA